MKKEHPKSKTQESNLNELPIVQGLEAYRLSNKWRFHMPGHQGHSLFKEMLILQKNLYSWDVTEVEGADNLQNPTEMILESAEKLAEIMGAGKSYFLVNGSTCGILAALWALFEPEDTVLVQRNCHQAVFHGMEIRRLQPLYLYPSILESWNLASHITVESIEDMLHQYPQIKGVIITSPSYYGICSDLKKIASLCQKKRIPLVVDEAHGAHFNFLETLPPSAMESGADVSICSFHKTLPSFTQTAVLNVGEKALSSYEENINYSLRLFQTTSPSYLFLASMDMCRNFMEGEGALLLQELQRNMDAFREEMRLCKSIRLLQKEDMAKNVFLDWTRLVFHSPGKGKALMEALRQEFAIEGEMHDEDHVVCICTVATSKEALDHLSKSIRELDQCYEKDDFENLTSLEKNVFQEIFPKTEVVFPPYDAQKKPWEIVRIAEGVGKICGESVIPYPPGIPLIYPGEKFTPEILERIQVLEESGVSILKDKVHEKGFIAILSELVE